MQIAVLDRNNAAAFRQMTFPMFRRLLDFEPALPPLVALGAFDAARPGGLALAAIDSNDGAAELLSLYVEAEHRGKGLGARLLAAAEDELARNGVREVAATYMSGQPTTAALEAVFRKCGWDDPVPRMLVVRFSLESIGRAPWIKRYALPTGWEIVPWVVLEQTEREEIRCTQETAPWIPPDLVPFQHESGLEPVTSLALRVFWRLSNQCGWYTRADRNTENPTRVFLCESARLRLHRRRGEDLDRRAGGRE